MSLFDALRNRYRVNAEPQRSQRRLELLLLALLLVVVLQVVWWLMNGLREPDVATVEPARDSLRVVDVNATGTISASQSLQLQSRPLFWVSRRPVVQVSAPSTADSGSGESPARRLEDLQVTGALGAGDQGKAIVVYKEKRMRLGIGDSVAGWTLQSVGFGEVVFASAGARDVRRLMPLPVVAVQNTPPPDAQAPEAAETAKAAQNKNNKEEGSLSLGG
ncbi:MAG: hypothetical protein NWQ45_11045 [Congregibacter sp.]|nr:hypothetical protein [Congregibacter sp.]